MWMQRRKCFSCGFYKGELLVGLVVKDRLIKVTNYLT